MAMNFSFSFGYLALNNVYNHDAEYNQSSQISTTLTNKDIKVTLYPRWYKHVAVEWSVPAEWGRCLFNVYFSPSDAGPFERLNSAPIDGNTLKDIESEEYLKFNRGYYIVEAILLDQDSSTIRSPLTSWDTYQNRWVELRSIEIQRREYILLTKFVGVKTYVFTTKTYGERCPECWSHTAEKSVKDHCMTCFGTSFKGGYFGPVTTYMQYDPTPNQNMKVYFGTFEPNQIGAWTISFPEVRPDDVIVRSGDWNVYRVDSLADTELRAKTVRQIMRLTQLAKGNIENELLTRIPDFPKEYL